MNIKTGDSVVVISGKKKYTKEKAWIESKKLVTHKVVSVDPQGMKAIVEGVNVATKHQKPKKQGQDGGIIKVETPIYVSKLMLVCPKCGKPTRVGHKRVPKTISGKEKMVSIRVCKNDGCHAEDI